MKLKGMEQTFGLVAVILIGAALRLIPHPANISPVAALALFGGAAFGVRRAYAVGLLLPLAALALSDCVLGFHALMPVVYASFILVGLVGVAIGPRLSAARIAAGSVAGSLLFFFVTNTAVWWTSGMYARTSAGLAECFAMAIPFFERQVVGDLFYSAVFFGAWAFVLSKSGHGLVAASLSSRKV